MKTIQNKNESLTWLFCSWRNSFWELARKTSVGIYFCCSSESRLRVFRANLYFYVLLHFFLNFCFSSVRFVVFSFFFVSLHFFLPTILFSHPLFHLVVSVPTAPRLLNVQSTRKKTLPEPHWELWRNFNSVFPVLLNSKIVSLQFLLLFIALSLSLSLHVSPSLYFFY